MYHTSLSGLVVCDEVLREFVRNNGSHCRCFTKTRHFAEPNLSQRTKLESFWWVLEGSLFTIETQKQEQRGCH